MNDKELLSFAAKAAGISIKMFNSNGHALIHEQQGGPESCLVTIWNPLMDDAQAFRLAFLLRLSVEFLDGFKQVQAYRREDAIAKAYHLFGVVGYGAGTDRHPSLENVRRAIVIAAAEIGRGMA